MVSCQVFRLWVEHGVIKILSDVLSAHTPKLALTQAYFGQLLSEINIAFHQGLIALVVMQKGLSTWIVGSQHIRNH